MGGGGCVCGDNDLSPSGVYPQGGGVVSTYPLALLTFENTKT